MDSYQQLHQAVDALIAAHQQLKTDYAALDARHQDALAKAGEAATRLEALTPLLQASGK